jgi:hypothetical protein
MPLRSQGSPLRSGMDKPLTSFTPLFNRAIIGLSPKALSFYFSFPLYLVVRGIASAGTPPLEHQTSLCFFSLAGARPLRAGGSPEGLGLDGIRSASSQGTCASQGKKESAERTASGSRNKLQVKVTAYHPFEGFGNLSVQPSLKPSDSKGIVYPYMSSGVCYL